MRLFDRLLCRSNAGALMCVLLCLQPLQGQAPQLPRRQDQSDVLRVYTELVQTDVMVFDKQGRFVDGLKREDFELRIDGKTKPIEFFEKISTGSVNEELQLAAARGSSRANLSKPGGGPVPLDRGRPTYFYIDDFHLNLQGVTNTQKLIRNFIDKQLGQNDEVAIAAASGQIGFLSQLTDNKAVLRAAVQRLKYRPYSVRDYDTPRMTEYQALLISNYDPDVTDFFTEYLMRNNPGLGRETAEQMVRSRAGITLTQSGHVTANTLAGLEALVKSANKIAGRKLVFFISDGFFLDDHNTDARERLRRITSAAARGGVVIYSIDSRGLVPGFADASTESQMDPSGRLMRSASGELTASQDGLNALASDTGGKAFFNSNSMEPAVKQAIEETATYYLLAWKPVQQSSGSGKFHRIEVRITGRPDVTVQVRRGFFDLEPEQTAGKEKKEQPPPSAANTSKIAFQKLITAPYPEREIPVSLRARFLNTPDKGDVLLATILVPTQFLTFKPLDGKHTAHVALLGGVFNEKGEAGASFNKQVTMSAATIGSANGGEDLVYAFSTYLKPGLYQVRVGARDDHSGRGGSAHAWIEIPNLASGQLTLSSVLLGGRGQPAISNASVDPIGFSATDLRVTNRFSGNDFLRFLVFVYNATAGPDGSKPDLAIQIHIVRDDQPVITAPLKKLSLEGVADLKRIPYAAELSLEGLRSGSYVLQISVLDRIAKTSTTQQTRFEVE
jgi:VWFA-related protein